MYHSVPAQSGSTSSEFALAAPDFRAQVDYLKSAGYHAVLPREVILALDGELRLPARAVVFSFDDALQSVYDQAFPVLAQAGYRAVVYVVAGQIGGHNAWDFGKNVPVESCMDGVALTELLNAGWEIGSHGQTHSDLTKLTSEALLKEVAGSKADLESRVGLVESFCYPYAAYNSEVRQAVVDAGYTNSAALYGPTRTVTADRFVMKRVFVKGSQGLPTFRRKISRLGLALRGLRRI